MKIPAMVLIHSPLVGPFTWALVAEKFLEKGIQAVVPALIGLPASSEPYWKQHASAVASALCSISTDQPVLLVGHSGAGPMLPAVRQSLAHTVAGYLFVDAGWPASGKSRLDQFENEEAKEQFRQSAQHGLLPVWSEEDLRAVIPDNSVRERFVNELQPLPLNVYEEELPVPAGWPDAPCGYLRFGNNPAYDRSTALARKSGFPVVQLDGEHFHMLVDPTAVCDAILILLQQTGIGPLQ